MVEPFYHFTCTRVSTNDCITVGDAVSFFHAERVRGRSTIEGGLLPQYFVHIHTTEERHRLQGKEGGAIISHTPFLMFIRTIGRS